MENTDRRTTSWGEALRIIWAITAKDILDALKNKTTLGVLLSVLFVLVVYQLLPKWQRGSNLPLVLVYDAGASDLLPALKQSPHLDVYTGYTSQEQLERKLVAGDIPELALTVPAGFDQSLARGEPLPVQGYVQHWVSETDAAQLQTQAAEELTRLAGQPVAVHLEGNLVYPTPDSGGRSFLASLAVLVSVTMIGVMLAPHLMIEEKQTRTLDALLVSPARSSHLVIAKALMGLSYCLLAATAVLVVNANLVLHWGLAIVTVLLSSLFAVAVGLLIGSLVEAKPMLPMWLMVALTMFLLPLFLAILKDLMPAAVRTIVDWVPTVTLGRMLRASLSRDLAAVAISLELVVVVACTALVLAGVAWIVRRSDR